MALPRPRPNDTADDDLSPEERAELDAAERDAAEGRTVSHAHAKAEFAEIAGRIANGTFNPNDYADLLNGKGTAFAFRAR